MRYSRNDKTSELGKTLLICVAQKHPELNQSEIARRLGVDPTVTNNWWNGYGMNLESAVRVAREFDVDLNVLKGDGK